VIRDVDGRWHLVLVVAVVFALYGRALSFGFSYLDDDALVLDQQAFLSQPSSVWRSFGRTYLPSAGRDHAYYRPVMNASLALDARWSGVKPFGYHLTSVMLHALAAALLLVLLRALGHGDRVALFGGLVFAVHPGLTEAVAWIPGRSDVLLVVFGLSAWLLFLQRFRRPAPNTRRALWSTLGHGSAWLLALLSKEAAIVLPAAFSAHQVWLQRQPWRRVIGPRRLAVWLGGLGVYFAARTVVVGDTIGVARLSITDLLANSSWILTSFGKLAVPAHLSVVATRLDTPIWPGVLASGMAVTTLIAPGLRQVRTRLLFALGCFVLFAAPALPASRVLILENRLYLPAVAFVMWISEVGGAMALSSRTKLGLAGAAIGALSVVSSLRLGDFNDRVTFFESAVRASPHSSLAHRFLGLGYHQRGDEDAAAREYQAALAEDPEEPVAHNNLAVIFMAHGRLPEAEDELRKELAVNPAYAPAYHNLALVLDGLGRRDEGASAWERSLELNPRDWAALTALLAYYQQRDARKADGYRKRLDTR